MFECSGPTRWLESSRVPCTQSSDAAGTGLARWLPNGRALGWRPASPGLPLLRYELGSVPVYARGLAEEPPAWGEGWQKGAPLTEDGESAAFVWRAADGSIFLPFDPDAAIEAMLSEAYVSAGGRALPERAKGVARKLYYRLRPLMPRSAQLALRRRYSRVQMRQRFPHWPVETGLHDLDDLLLQLAADVAGEPLPSLAAWPRPYSWSLVLTHDVETGLGYGNIDRICAVEERLGYRSAWNLVPRRDYTVEDSLVAGLWEAGWEVGVHGLHHDGRDLESEQLLRERLPEMRRWAERWRATGFRAPATQRLWHLMPSLGFDYDSSYPDTDPFEPQGGGCCTWLPFFNESLVELPLTLAQDHTLFAILEEPDGRKWSEKARFLRERGGMALLDTHPDYLGEEPAAGAYAAFLEDFAGDESAWRALPGEVARWWRRRADTRIERHGEGWVAVGPAAEEAVVRLTQPQAA